MRCPKCENSKVVVLSLTSSFCTLCSFKGLPTEFVREEKLPEYLQGGIIPKIRSDLNFETAEVLKKITVSRGPRIVTAAMRRAHNPVYTTDEKNAIAAYLASKEVKKLPKGWAINGRLPKEF